MKENKQVRLGIRHQQACNERKQTS